MISEDIKRQEAHHREMTFEQEFIALIGESGRCVRSAIRIRVKVLSRLRRSFLLRHYPRRCHGLPCRRALTPLGHAHTGNEIRSSCTCKELILRALVALTWAGDLSDSQRLPFLVDRRFSLLIHQDLI